MQECPLIALVSRAQTLLRLASILKPKNQKLINSYSRHVQLTVMDKM